MRIPILALILSVALLPASAEHCTSYSTSSPLVDAGGYYVDDDQGCPDLCGYVWIYQESNGIPGLQRGDEITDDRCHGLIASDTIIF